MWLFHFTRTLIMFFARLAFYVLNILLFLIMPKINIKNLVLNVLKTCFFFVGMGNKNVFKAQLTFFDLGKYDSRF